MRSLAWLGAASVWLAVGCSGSVEPVSAADAGGPDAPVRVRDAAAPADAGKEDLRPKSPAVEIDLGEVQPGTAAAFEVPAGTLGFTVLAVGAGGDEAISVQTIRSPSGAAVHEGMTPFGGTHPTSMTLFGETATAGVPQSEHRSTMPAVEVGRWTVTFGGSSPVHGHVRVQRTPDGIFHGGVVDVHVYVPEGLNLDGEIASTANVQQLAGVSARLESFDTAIRDLYGLELGKVAVHLIDRRFVTMEDSLLLDAFRRTSLGGSGQALHVVLTTAGPNQQWWGIAGGIPGAATIAGTSQSGIALATLEAASAGMEGYVLAHEMGHFFGLNHTSEFNEGGFDPLKDTPECPGITVDNFNRCPDASNIMAAAGAVTGFAVSTPLQRRVVQGSPVYRALTSGVAPKGVRLAAPDFGRLFGHPGAPLTSVEGALLARLCGSAPRAPARLGDASRAEAARLAADPRLAPVVRRVAAGLATGR